MCAVAAWGLPSASALLVLWFTALNKGKWPPFRTHWYDYLLYGAAACPPARCHPCWQTLEGQSRRAHRRDAARLAGTTGFLLDSEHASAAVLDSVLHLRDSPLAGECAAIVKAKNPSARSAPCLPLPARAPRLRPASWEATSLHHTTCTCASGQQRSDRCRVAASGLCAPLQSTASGAALAGKQRLGR